MTLVQYSSRVKGLRVMTSNQWAYSLTPAEEGVVARIGYERQAVFFGRPEANRNYSEGDVWELWQHAVAAGAELAAARMFGLTDFVPSVNTYKTELDIPNYEIRYCFTPSGNKPHTLRYRSDIDNPEANYILLIGGLEAKVRRTAENGYKSPPYYAVGWVRGENVKHIGRQLSANYYRVESQELNPMAALP
jgi:hypothetical protein